NHPRGVAVDKAGNVYVADQFSDTIKELSLQGSTWAVATIAGSPNIAGSADGTNNAALFDYPLGLAVDSATNIYVADGGNDLIRKISPIGTNWVVTTIAGLPGVVGT